MYPRTMALIALVFYLLAPAVSAETMRCEGKIVSNSMTQSELLSLCGEPDERITQNHYKWIYRGTGGNRDTEVSFYANGDIESIESVAK